MPRRTIYSTLLPIYAMTQLVGLVPFDFNKRGCQKSRFKIVWSVICMILVNVCLVMIDTDDVVTSGFTATATKFLYNSSSHIGTFCQIVCGCIYVNDYVRLLSFLEHFDKKIKKLLNIDINFEYERSRKYVNLFVGMLTTLTILMIFGIILDWCLYEQASFCSLVLCFKQRFKWLNNKIEMSAKATDINLTEYDPSGMISRQSPKIEPSVITVVTDTFHDQVIGILREVRRKHYQLCDNSQKLNKIYLAQNFVIIFQDFITIIKCLFYCSKLSIVTDDIPIDFVAYLSIIFIMSVVHILVIVSCCSRTMSEAQNAGPLIHKLLSSNSALKEKNREELQLEVSFFSLQLFHQRPEFTVAGMFPIDETLIFSMVGVTTTYLIIIIQFELQ